MEKGTCMCQQDNEDFFKSKLLSKLDFLDCTTFISEEKKNDHLIGIIGYC